MVFYSVGLGSAEIAVGMVGKCVILGLVQLFE